jgi:F0F1-type ATP synthase membrane subunit b/b'
MNHLFTVIATAITFFILGITLEMIVATSVITRVIDRRQREIRHWQDQVQRFEGRHIDTEHRPI